MIKRSQFFGNSATIMIGFGFFDSIYGPWKSALISMQPIAKDIMNFDRLTSVLAIVIVFTIIHILDSEDKTGPILSNKTTAIDWAKTTLLRMSFVLLCFTLIGPGTALCFFIGTVFLFYSSFFETRENMKFAKKDS